MKILRVEHEKQHGYNRSKVIVNLDVTMCQNPPHEMLANLYYGELNWQVRI